MKYLIASDHGGFDLKKAILEEFKNLEIEDVGPFNADRVDYTDFANELSKRVSESNGEINGILICSTGMGMSMASNKHKNVRAALCTDSYVAKMSKMHNNSNIICMGQSIVGKGLAIDMIEEWMNAQFEGGRHIARVDKMLI